MFFEDEYLKKGVAWLSPDNSPEALLAALADPINEFVVLANRLVHGRKVKLLVRERLIRLLLKTPKLDLIMKRKWNRLLKSEPAMLPDFIQFLETGKIRSKTMVWSMPSLDWSLVKFVNHWFGSPDLVPVTDFYSAARRFSPGPRVIVRDGNISGIYEAPFQTSGSSMSIGRSVYRDSPRVEYRELPRLEIHEDTAFGSSDFRRVVPQPQKPSPFVAHPRITPLDDAVCGLPLRFAVGFSKSPDAHADEQKRIKITDANPGEKITVFFSADGASVEDSSVVDLALELAAEHVFRLVPLTGTEELVLRASYLFRGKLVGCIVKVIALKAKTNETLELDPAASSVPDPQVFPLSDPTGIAAPDIHLWVQKGKPGYISWRAHIPSAAGDKSIAPAPQSLERPEMFAASLALIQSRFATHSYSGIYDELRGVGRQILNLIPEEIIEALRLALSDGRSPSILLVTDVPYVPWELAYLNPEDSGRESGAFLGELVIMGRWWSARNCPAPASSVSVEVISALASGYEGSMSPLAHALKEREMLCRDYNARSIDARLPEVEAWLDAKPHQSGHLVHVALHGYADDSNDSYILKLEDNEQLTPYRFAGFAENNIPRFAAVFLNACQVGGAGQKLGFLSGFPGAVAEAGTQAFIAPLWEVKDESALKVAETFYRNSFGDSQKTVGETFRDIRATAQDSCGITPFAYMFYGHPLLRLTKSSIANDESKK